MKLVYINELGPDYKGNNIYEFIFSDEQDVWGEDWDAQPAAGAPSPPQLKYIKEVGILKDTDLELDLVQNSDYFAVTHALDNVIALGWEHDDSKHIINDINKRLVFHFGDKKEDVKDKLYARDIVLTYEKKLVEDENRR